jgi:hypothetical protein
MYIHTFSTPENETERQYQRQTPLMVRFTFASPKMIPKWMVEPNLEGHIPAIRTRSENGES